MMMPFCLLLTLFTAPQDSPVTWQARKGEAYCFRCFDISGGKPVQLHEPFLDFACELKTDGTNSIACRGPRDIPWLLLFTLQGKVVRKGETWNYERDFFSTPIVSETALPVPRVRVRGKFTVSVTDKSQVEIAGTFGFFEGQERKGQWVPENLPSATLETYQVFNVDGKRLESGRYLLAGSVRENCSVREGVHIRAQKVRVARRIERAEKDWKIDPKELLPAINDAITKGRDWLAKQQRNDGGFEGRPAGYWVVTSSMSPSALALQALLHTGTPPDDPVAKRTWSYILSKERALTYEVHEISLALLALETRHAQEDRGLVEKWAKWPVEAELKPVPKEFSGNYWQPPDDDLINAWYAVMALKAASRCGYEVPSYVWKTLLRRFAQAPYPGTTPVELDLKPLPGSQLGVLPGPNGWKSEPGAWGYFTLRGLGSAKEMEGHASETCFALSLLKTCESELERRGESEEGDRKRVHDALRQGLAWLQSNYSVRAVRPEAGAWGVWHHVYLLALKEAASALGVWKIGGHDWYLEGAAHLLATQRADGSWSSLANEPTQDTALALLYLKGLPTPVETKNGK